MMFEGRHFQNAYIKRDLDKQAARLNAQGVLQHMITEADMEVKTRNGTARSAVEGPRSVLRLGRGICRPVPNDGGLSQTPR
jgi:hypothetical protein